MKKRFLSLFLMLLLFVGSSFTVQAETFYNEDNDWNVVFTSQKKMVSNFKTSKLDETISFLQPGDDVIFEVTLQNDYKETTDWWMTNKVLQSLEDNSANKSTHGGAYTYVLTYTDKNGSDYVLYSSETIGGDEKSNDREGLREATDALEEYFYLDTLATGESGKITLEVALDGETQGNDYQDTLADLQMNFAVELVTGEPNSRRLWRREKDSDKTTIKNNDQLIEIDQEEVPRSIIRTGDETNLTPFYIVMAVSGILILLLAVYSMKQNSKEKKERVK